MERIVGEIPGKLHGQTELRPSVGPELRAVPVLILLLGFLAFVLGF
jgi:hypothetical protein